MNNNSLVNLLIVLACGIIGLMVFLLVIAFFAMRWLQRYIMPDVGEMKRQLEDLRAANPTLSNEALISKIIRQQSIKCGIVGAITGLGGFFTLPVALPIDILMSMRIQSAMVQFISLVYNPNAISADELKLQTTLVMTGGLEITETTTNLIMRGVVRLLGESLAIVLPAIGSIVGFLVNFGLAQATGNIAMRWYASKAAGQTSISGPSQAALKRGQ
jgi:hypothetical protein